MTWVAVAAVTGACERDGLPERTRSGPSVEFDTAAVRIETPADTFRMTVELAGTAEQRSYGLMDRPELPADHGMLFLYGEPQDSSAGFWMFRTLIPLDIAFLDAEGRIVAIRRMDPCESPNPRVCRTYSPGVPYSGALEVARGYFEQRGIDVGDRVVLIEEDQK